MSEINIEQLRVLFENLQDRLDKTQGDKLSQDELEKIRVILAKQTALLAKQGNKSTNTNDDHRKFLNDFWASWRQQQPLRGMQNRPGTGRQNNPQDRQGGTYIDRKRAEADETTARDTIRRDRLRGQVENTATNRLKTFSTGVNTATGVVTGFMSQLKQGNLLGALGGGALGGAIDSMVKDRVTAYRDMIATGEGSFGSMREMNDAVNAAHMTSQELADILKNSQGARMSGGQNITQAIAQFNKNTNAIANMGLSREQEVEALEAFTDIATKQGMINRLSSDQIANGMQSLVQNTQETAHILGLTRTEALARQKELAADNVLNAVIRGKGLDTQAVDRVLMTMDKFGPAATKMTQELLANGNITSKKSATYATFSPEVMKMAENLTARLRNGEKISAEEIAKMGQATADKVKADPRNTIQAGMTYADGMSSEVVDAITGRLDAASATFNTKAAAPKLDNAGDRAELGSEEAMRSVASAARQVADSLHESFKMMHGAQMEHLKDLAIEKSEMARIKGRDMQDSNPGDMSKMAIGIMGVLAAVTAIKTGMGAMRFAQGARRIAGRGAARAAGTPRPGRPTPPNARPTPAGPGGRTGGTWIGDRLRGASGAAEGATAGAVAKGLGKALGKSALIGSLFEAFDYATGQKAISAKNMAKSGLRVAGGALGGLAGGGVASIATGAAGYYGGDMLGNYLFGEDDKPKSPTGAQEKPKPIAQQQRAQPGKQGDATGQRARNQLTPEQMNQRIMEAQEKATTYLKNLKENSDTQVELMREEIRVMRYTADRQARLLEEGNRNTRSIADHAA